MGFDAATAEGPGGRAEGGRGSTGRVGRVGAAIAGGEGGMGPSGRGSAGSRRVGAFRIGLGTCRGSKAPRGGRSGLKRWG
jgi:hypothetical protein